MRVVNNIVDLYHGRSVPDFKGASLTTFLKQNEAPGRTIFTGGLKSFTAEGHAVLAKQNVCFRTLNDDAPRTLSLK
jgi:hypothetical protein